MDHIRILNLIEPYVELHPDSPAIIDPEGNMLNYTVLYDTVFSLASCLSSHGIKKNQRIAAAMDSKMEIAVLYLAVSSIASFVPLDADFSVENFRYYLKLLKVDCLILSENYQGPLLVLAAKMNLKTFYLKRNKMNQQISYEFSAQYGRENKRPLIFAQDHDIAVVNYTSGTTTEPKIVPRSHINEYSYAMQSVANLQLSESDKVLIMIPMFRGAALNMMLASLASGGTVICTEKISADLIFQKIDEYSVTWFFSIPSISKRV